MGIQQTTYLSQLKSIKYLIQIGKYGFIDHKIEHWNCFSHVFAAGQLNRSDRCHRFHTQFALHFITLINRITTTGIDKKTPVRFELMLLLIIRK